MVQLQHSSDNPPHAAGPSAPEGKQKLVIKRPAPKPTTRGVFILQVLGLIIVPLAIVGVIDHLNGPHFSMSLFYLIPIAIAVMLRGRTGGLLCALLAGVTFFLANLAGAESVWEALWNTAMRLGVFLFVALLLPSAVEKLDRMLHEER